jgi:hypothetical protein
MGNCPDGLRVPQARNQTSIDELENTAELSARTFCTFAREYPSFRRQGLPTGSDLIPDSVPPIPLVRRAVPGSPDFASRRSGQWRPSGRNGGQPSMVTRPRRLAGIPRTTPFGWLQRVSGARRPRVTSGLPGPRPLFQSTSRQASVRETPNAEARDCVRRRRTLPVDGRW